MSLTRPEWMSLVAGTAAPCPTPSPTAPWPARAPATAPATDRAPAPAHARALATVRLLTSTPTCVKPIVPARDRATSPASVTAQDQDSAQVLTKDPRFPHCLTVSSLKGPHSHLSRMPLTHLPRAFLLSPTSWALCRCIPPGCCWCATAAWPISSWWRPSRRWENGLCGGRTNPWRRAFTA